MSGKGERESILQKRKRKAEREKIREKGPSSGETRGASQASERERVHCKKGERETAEGGCNGSKGAGESAECSSPTLLP